MNNELLEQKSWWKRNWKWFVPVSGILLVSIFLSAGMGGIGANLAQAYSDTELYQKALDQVKADERVAELLGDLEPIDKLAILEGEVQYSNENQTVRSTIRLKGTKGKAKMDLVADKVDSEWEYKKIYVRITNPPEDKQTIKVIGAE